MPKKILIALAPGLLEQVDHIAKVEHRTRSDTVREALRRYISNFHRQQPGVHQAVISPEPWPNAVQ